METDTSFAFVSPDPTIIRLRPAREPGPQPRRLNPLSQAGMRGLLLAARIRKHGTPANLDELHLHCVRVMRTFEEKALQMGLPKEEVVASSYAMCMVIDEAVLGNPSAASAGWNARSMSMTFHGEASCSRQLERFAARAMAEPTRYLAFLQFLYSCLSIGLRDGHPIRDAVARRLMEKRHDLLVLIQTTRGTAIPEVPQPQPVPIAARRRVMPLWVIAGVGLTLITAAVIVAGSAFRVHQEREASDRVEMGSEQ